VGHARQRAHAELLVAVARRNAGRIVARDLLDDFWRVFERFPKLRVAFAMAAARSHSQLAASNMHFMYARIWLRSTTQKPRSYLARGNMPARFFVDSLVHDPDALRLLLKLFGPRRVAFGSDYPFPLGEAHPGKLVDR